VTISLFFNIITSFILTYVVIPPIVKVSNVKNLMDVPDHRKLNKAVVPTLGGIAIFIGLNLSSLLFMPTETAVELRFLFAAIILMFFIGLKDDILIISAKKKFAVQIIAAAILVVLGKYQITELYGLFGIHHLIPAISIPLSILIFLFLINAINLIDGIDGLASGITLLVSSCLGVWFYMTGNIAYGVICTALAGSLLAFLRFNLWGGKNKIFMGDTGSLILGVVVSAMIIKFIHLNSISTSEFRIEQAPLLALSLLIIPITDTLRVFTIRIYNKKSPFSPDMNHLHHLLIKSRLTHIQASSFLVAYTVFFIMLASTLSLYFNITVSFVLVIIASYATVGLMHLKMRKIHAFENGEINSNQIKIINLFPAKEKPVYSLVNGRKKRI